MESTQFRTLVNYFKKNTKKGYKLESLKWALINQGYSRSVVEKALAEAEKEKNQEIEKQKEKDKPKIKYELYGIDENPFFVTSNILPWWKKLLNSVKRNL
jgi:hypothetical protein